MIRKESDISIALHDAIAKAGYEKVFETLERLTSDNHQETLTIIVNSGVHHVANEYVIGEKFVASEGSLDFSTDDSIHREFRKILLRVAKKLKSHSWKKVYLIPFGPTVLSMQIKLLVYRVCGIESVDVMNVAGRDRANVCFDLRQIIVQSDQSEDD